MKRYLAAPILVLAMSVSLFAAKGPEINIIDNKLSVSADSVSLGRLLQLFDLATGMKSKVPPELANRNLSVRFSDLGLTDAVRKMFQGQAFDYVVIEGQGIVITSASQNLGGTDSSTAVYNPPPTVQPGDPPFVQDYQQQIQAQQQIQGVPFQTPQQIQQQQQQPAMVQTPFGPIPNTRAQQPNTAVTTPGQQNSLFPQSTPFGQPQTQQQPVQIVPGTPIGNPAPFGTTTPFGTPPATNPNNNTLFGNGNVFPTTPGSQQR